MRVDGAQGVHPVALQRQEGAHVLRATGVRLVDHRVDAGALQCHGGDRPGHSTADDHRGRHAYPPLVFTPPVQTSRKAEYLF
jgi:hypothetical protein